MTRILTGPPEEGIKSLDARAAEQGKSRSEVLHEAVAWYFRKPEEAECAS